MINTKDPLAGKRLLIGIGAQKSGTTWLSDHLRQNPQVFMSPIKELHYFDLKYAPASRPIQEPYFLHRMKVMANGVQSFSEIQNNTGTYVQLKNYIDRFEMKSVDDYLDFFRNRVGDERVCCEISPGYALLEAEHYREIYTMHDDVRLLFIMRDPVARYWSNLRFYEGLLPNFDAKENIRKGLRDAGAVGRTDYMRTINAVEEIVPPEHFLTLFYEELFTNETILQVADFAGITPQKPDFDKKVLKSREIPLDEDVKADIYKSFAHVYEGMYERTNGKLPTAWLDSMRRYGNRNV